RLRELFFWIMLLAIVLVSVPVKDRLLRPLATIDLPGDINFFLNLRVWAAFNNLDRIVQSRDPVTLVFGSSEIEGFFDPALLQEAAARKDIRLSVFNLGLRKLLPARFQ